MESFRVYAMRHILCFSVVAGLVASNAIKSTFGLENRMPLIKEGASI